MSCFEDKLNGKHHVRVIHPNLNEDDWQGVMNTIIQEEEEKGATYIGATFDVINRAVLTFFTPDEPQEGDELEIDLDVGDAFMLIEAVDDAMDDEATRDSFRISLKNLAKKIGTTTDLDYFFTVKNQLERFVDILKDRPDLWDLMRLQVNRLEDLMYPQQGAAPVMPTASPPRDYQSEIKKYYEENTRGDVLPKGAAYWSGSFKLRVVDEHGDTDLRDMMMWLYEGIKDKTPDHVIVTSIDPIEKWSKENE